MKTLYIEDMHIKLESIFGVFIFHLKIYSVYETNL